MIPRSLPSPLHILVVDDDRVDRMAARKSLEEAGLDVEVAEATTVSDGVARLREGGVHCALVDFKLPDGEGSEVLRASLDLHDPVPVIMLTGHGDEGLAVELMKEGARDYIPKGAVSAARLSQSVRQVVTTRMMEREADAARRAQEILVEAGIRLAQSLDFETTLATVAEICVPALADYVVVDVLEESGELSRSSVRAADAGLQNVLEDSARTPPPLDEGSSAGRVLEEGRGLRLSEPEEEWRALVGLEGGDGEVERLLQPASLLVLPLVARGRTVGILTLASTRDERRYTDEDLGVGQALANRAALAVDNARLHREAQDAVRARDETLGVVSHDLRNPLNVISAAAGLILDIPLPEEKKEQQLHTIRRAAERMDVLIQDLLDVSGMEAGHFAVETEPIEVEAILGETCEMMEPLARERNVRLECRIPDGDPRVLADRERILRVFSNLIGNALKFTPAEGTVEIGGEPVEEGVRFWVRDTGPGIPEEDIPRLFDRFWKGGGAGGREGAGLGLPIAQGIVDGHGGSIEVETRQGEGSTFHFVLPMADAGRAEGSAVEPVGG